MVYSRGEVSCRLIGQPKRVASTVSSSSGDYLIGLAGSIEGVASVELARVC